MHTERKRKEGADTPRILVVEDNMVNRKLAVALVQKWGFSPLVAEDGQEALTILEKEHVDLILMDVQMPVMDGLEATRAIRAREAERGGHLPIVALTAHAYMSDRDKCFDAGMDDFLTKPVDHRALHETILSLLRTSSEEIQSVTPGAAEACRPQFDRQEALGRVDGDQELLEEIAALFLDSSNTWLEDLRRGIVDSDAVVIEKSAHTLKGSAATFGARSLVESALQVEKIGASGELAGVDSAARELESLVGTLTGELRSFLEERLS